MAEYLRDVTVRIEIDTNKSTREQTFHMESCASLGDLIAEVRVALIELEERPE